MCHLIFLCTHAHVYLLFCLFHVENRQIELYNSDMHFSLVDCLWIVYIHTRVAKNGTTLVHPTAATIEYKIKRISLKCSESLCKLWEHFSEICFILP